MADSVIVSKDEMRNILGELMKRKVVFAPASNGEVLDFLKVRDVNDIVLNDELPYKSPKEIFFPRCEKIITFKDGEATSDVPTEQTVLFGARPCDLNALGIIKTIFTKGKFLDPFFQERYNNALIIGLACNAKKPACFCDERETDMGYSDKCDLFLAENGEGYEVLFVSEKGREELGAYIAGLTGFENSPHESDLAETLTLEATEADLFERIGWDRITEICQGCGVCTFVCPTCHCFMFKDVDEGDRAYRYKSWDSCMYPKFTQHASGHNPRASKAERYRQRVAHKYVYIPENFGMTACTGCGRCIRSCPAGMNIKTIVEGIVEELK